MSKRNSSYSRDKQFKCSRQSCFACLGSHIHLDRDLNAAFNIPGLGLRDPGLSIEAHRFRQESSHSSLDDRTHSLLQMVVNSSARSSAGRIRRSVKSPGERHGSCITIHSDGLFIVNPFSCGTCAKNGWDMIFAGHNRTMAEWATYISNYPCSQGEEWRPGGCCDPGDQNSPPVASVRTQRGRK